jgi:hypothetical protein
MACYFYRLNKLLTKNNSKENIYIQSVELNEQKILCLKDIGNEKTNEYLHF